MRVLPVRHERARGGSLSKLSCEICMTSNAFLEKQRAVSECLSDVAQETFCGRRRPTMCLSMPHVSE